jgi:hypothetical protein
MDNKEFQNIYGLVEKTNNLLDNIKDFHGEIIGASDRELRFAACHLSRAILAAMNDKASPNAGEPPFDCFSQLNDAATHCLKAQMYAFDSALTDFIERSRSINSTYTTEILDYAFPGHKQYSMHVQRAQDFVKSFNQPGKTINRELLEQFTSHYNALKGFDEEFRSSHNILEIKKKELEENGRKAIEKAENERRIANQDDLKFDLIKKAVWLLVGAAIMALANLFGITLPKLV